MLFRSLSVLKERTSYFSDLSRNFGDEDEICSVKMDIANMEEYKKYIESGEYTKDNILQIFEICNFLSDIDAYSLAFKLQDFCSNDLNFSIRAISTLSTTEYTYQLKKIFHFTIDNYDRHTVYDLVSKDTCYNELFKLMFFNIV